MILRDSQDALSELVCCCPLQEPAKIKTTDVAGGDRVKAVEDLNKVKDWTVGLLSRCPQMLSQAAQQAIRFWESRISG
jgi:hypothetical protein